jgi:Protein of unknown function (DUF998)
MRSAGRDDTLSRRKDRRGCVALIEAVRRLSPFSCARRAEPISSQERLDPFPRAGDDVLSLWVRPDEHRAVERLTCHEIRELRGSAACVRHPQQANVSQMIEPRRQGAEHLTGSPIEVFCRESRTMVSARRRPRSSSLARRFAAVIPMVRSSWRPRANAEATSCGDGGYMESNQSEVARGASVTRSLLRWGVLAGPFYLAVSLIQAFLRDGFDLARHPLSLLANGPGGWIQTANFVLTGLMVLAAAVGFRRVLGPKSRAVTWFLGGFGVAMILAAIFPADPVDGFPPGTPEGFPTSISTTGLLHFVAGALGFTFLAISCFAAARATSRRHLSSLARLSLFSGLAIVLGFFGGFALPVGILGIWFAVLVGWAWLAVLSLGLNRLA